MKTITITVENDEHVAAVLSVLSNAEEDGDIDFAFNTEVSP